MTIAAAKAPGPMRAPALQNSPTYHYWRCQAPVEVEPRCRRASSWFCVHVVVLSQQLVRGSSRTRHRKHSVFFAHEQVSCTTNLARCKPWRSFAELNSPTRPRPGVVGSLVHWAYGPAVFITASHCLFFLDLFPAGPLPEFF